jgi:hypothetical protein
LPPHASLPEFHSLAMMASVRWFDLGQDNHAPAPAIIRPCRCSRSLRQSSTSDYDPLPRERHMFRATRRFPFNNRTSFPLPPFDNGRIGDSRLFVPSNSGLEYRCPEKRMTNLRRAPRSAFVCCRHREEHPTVSTHGGRTSSLDGRRPDLASHSLVTSEETGVRMSFLASDAAC